MEVGLDVILKHFGHWILDRYQVKDVEISEKELSVWNSLFNAYLVNNYSTNESEVEFVEESIAGMDQAEVSMDEIQATEGFVEEVTVEGTAEVVG